MAAIYSTILLMVFMVLLVVNSSHGHISVCKRFGGTEYICNGHSYPATWVVGLFGFLFVAVGVISVVQYVRESN